MTGIIRPHDLLRHPEGGSLNSIAFRDQTVVKSYAGPHERGYQKLRREHGWLCELPPHLRHHFPRPVLYVERSEPSEVELHLTRHPDPAIAKAILLGLLSPERTAATVADALAIMLDSLYPIRQGALGGAEVYSTYHSVRLATAIDALRKVVGIAPIIAATSITVNGYDCPPFGAIERWLARDAGRFFPVASRLVAGHGDLHLDNILTTVDGPIKLVYVDPRGEPLLPPHYDWAKMHKAVATPYDLIHYGRYSIRVQAEGGSIRIDIEPDTSYDGHYASALDALLGSLGAYADAEGLTVDAFCRAAAVAELAHVISFAFYHAHHPLGCNDDRVTAYLAVAALLARALMTAEPDHTPLLDVSLLSPTA